MKSKKEERKEKVKEEIKNRANKNYDAAMLLELHNFCNLDCDYCISNNRTKIQKTFDLDRFENFIKNLDKKFLFIYEGDGEPTLQPQILEISKIIAKHGHFIAITSNMTTDAVAKIAEQIDPENIDYVIASAHTAELEKKNLLQKYFKNCLLFRDRGVAVTCMEIGHPALIPEVPRLRKMFEENGLRLQFDHFRGKYNGKNYPFDYTQEELDIFGLAEVNEKFNVRGKYCNAGFNFFAAELVSGNGDIVKCRQTKHKVGNIWEGTFTPDKMPKVCLKKTCYNPYVKCNNYLYEKMEDKLNQKRGHPTLHLGKALGVAKEIGVIIRRKNASIIDRTKGIVGKGMKKVSRRIYISAKNADTKLTEKRKKQ